MASVVRRQFVHFAGDRINILFLVINGALLKGKCFIPDWWFSLSIFIIVVCGVLELLKKKILGLDYDNNIVCY